MDQLIAACKLYSLNKVEPDVNVFHPCMLYLIFCQIDSTHAITIDLQQILINHQVIKQPLKTNCLFHSLLMIIYSASVEDNVTVDYRIKRQLTGAWDNVNTYLIVDRRLSRSPV